ncbi:Poly(A)-specific ribonuclease-like protein [Ilyonectria robusta]
MEIDAGNFWELLPTLLLIIASSDYVAINLQMTDPAIKGELTSGDTISLNQVYGRVKDAAPKFEVTHLGITALHWNGNGYTSHSFRIAINPLLPDTTQEEQELSNHLDRRLNLSQTSLRFLQQYKLDLSAAFGNAVPYLTRRECNLARLRLTREIWPAKTDPMAINRKDVASIVKWIEDALQNWLKGLLWIFEALSGNTKKFAEMTQFGLNPRIQPPRPEVLVSLGQDLEKWQGSAAEQLLKVFRMAESSQPTLLVHNALVDLGFLYTMISGSFPHTKTAFQHHIHKDLFPSVIETKVLVTQLFNPTVHEVEIHNMYHEMRHMVLPVPTVQGWGHDINLGADGTVLLPYEAGSESYMTAIVFLKAASERWQSLRLEKCKTEPATDDNQSSVEAGSCGEASSQNLDTSLSEMDTSLSEIDNRLPRLSNDFWANILNRIFVGPRHLLELDEEINIAFASPGSLTPEDSFWSPQEASEPESESLLGSENLGAPDSLQQHVPITCERLLKDAHEHGENLQLFSRICREAFINEDEDLVRGQIREIVRELGEVRGTFYKFLQSGGD